MSADILKFADYYSIDVPDQELDLITAIDVAIRDLRQVLLAWGTQEGRETAEECARMLRNVYLSHRRA